MIKASPETIRGVASALGLSRLIDDRVGPADQGRIAAWAELVEPHKLTEPDLCDGVRMFYRGNQKPQMMQVGDLIACAREVRRERSETETEAEQTERQKRLESKVKQDVDDLAATKGVPPRFQRSAHGPGPLDIQCPWCRAAVGRHCTVLGGTGRPDGGFHPSRVDAARIAS